MSTARGLLFSGDIYMEPIVGGVLGDMVGPFEGGQFSIKPNSDQVDMVSTGRTTWGQIIESVGVQKPADLTVTLREYNPDVLALGLMGTVAALSQGAGSLVASPITAKLDKWVALTKASLTGVVTVKDVTDTTTYVEGTDYIVNRQLGRIKALAGGAIANSEVLHVSCAYAAIAGSSILGVQSSNLRVRFTLDGVNQADQTNVIVHVWEAVLSAADALDFLSGKFAEVKLQGRMKTPVGYSTPLQVDLRTAG